ncbi:MAG: hypothetical protein ABGX26_00385 [Nautiliaceae bacterium]
MILLFRKIYTKVAKEIKELNKKEQEIDEKIAKFCEELQIDTPF